MGPGRHATPSTSVTNEEILQRLREDDNSTAHQQMEDYPPEGSSPTHSEIGVFGGWMRRLFSRGW